MEHGTLDYYLHVYVDPEGNQVLKPFEDNENGRLKQIAWVFVYEKNSN
jgi:hypothetical protein